MSKLHLVLVVSVTVLALSGCGTTDTGIDGPVTIETLTGTLSEQKGMQVQAFDALNSESGTPLVTATVGESGEFALDLPESVASSQLTAATTAFECDDLPSVNLAMISSLALSNGGEVGAAALVPEGTTSISEADSFAVYVYSDRNVSIDITCAATATTGAGMSSTREGGQTLIITLLLALGWNVVLQSSDSESTHFRTANIPSNYFWLYNAAP